MTGPPRRRGRSVTVRNGECPGRTERTGLAPQGVGVTYGSGECRRCGADWVPSVTADRVVRLVPVISTPALLTLVTLANAAQASPETRLSRADSVMTTSGHQVT